MSHHGAQKYAKKLGKEGIFQKKWIFCEHRSIINTMEIKLRNQII